MEEKLQNLLKRTLEITNPLSQIGASHDTKFLNVILGIYRISFSTLRDIYYLAQNQETGASALDLTRKIIEYGITVEYMIWKGKEKKAEQFQNYMFVDNHKIIEFIKIMGQNLENQSKELRDGIEETEREYDLLDPKIKDRKGWAGLSADQMIIELHKVGILNDFELSRLSEAYLWGCRLNHASPFVVHKYLNPEDSKIASDYYLRQAIMFGVLFHLRIANRYIDEMRFLSNSNVHQELADKIKLIQDELENFNT